MKGIFKYESAEFSIDAGVQYEQVEFLKAFGPWHKGQKVEYLSAVIGGVDSVPDYVQLSEWSADGEELRSAKATLSVIKE